MRLTTAGRRAALSLHICCSVGWIGAAAAYLALAVAAAVDGTTAAVRAAWIAMEVIGWWVIVPFGALALLTGVLMAVGTPWGLLRHYWVLIALGLTTLAFVVLVAHMPSVTRTAAQARDGATDLTPTLAGEILHAGLGLVILVVVAVLNVVKPRGLTGLGQNAPRSQGGRFSVRDSTR